ncbi:hypothetical protein HEP87_00280 [Streptomyces sp. S1D4-11]|nr:hypothetical protein [Streptomyces sp. S1D4-11]QIY92973.1 hypothetical protein HEP87_00280 [Streptomyces sp. S1D4-11]
MRDGTPDRGPSFAQKGCGSGIRHPLRERRPLTPRTDTPNNNRPGANGQQYQQVTQWCWYLRDLGWRDAYQQPVPTVLLLLQDGRFARVRLDWPPQRGKYVTTVNVHLPEATDFPRDTINAYFWDTWLEELEKNVAKVLVRCERGE